ncbi:MAG: hypothetical protein M5U28_36630 [Sandaracinaceae bacterium]|nr:hypothetical protein [Sandaracinaceae bacterium]
MPVVPIPARPKVQARPSLARAAATVLIAERERVPFALALGVGPSKKKVRPPT